MRAAEAAYELSRSQEESRAAVGEKKMSELSGKLAKAEEKLGKAEKSLREVTVKYEKGVALVRQ